MSFASLNLIDPLVQSIQEQGYKSPSPIQEKVIPEVLAGKDVMAAAQTGTGKTAGFALPILQRLVGGQKAKSNSVRTLILTPTRELAAQVGEKIDTYAKHLHLSSFVVFGGVKINPQMMQLRRGVDVLVATPGRLFDLYQQKAIKFDAVECLVLDEADRMLDMGFLPDIKRILKLLPSKRQTLLFSATFSSDIKSLGQSLLNQPVSISVNSENSTASTVTHWVHPVDKKRKSPMLSYLIGHNNWQQVLVFVRTKRGANKVAFDLEKSGLKASAIHGNKSQGARTRALKEFKDGSIQILVATDIAARGLHIQNLPQVVNFDLPNVPEDYIHRIGRTGRAGSKGNAISLVSADEVDMLSDIENLLRQKINREIVDGFEPQHTVPETRLSAKRSKKKPHKKKIANAKEKFQKQSPGNRTPSKRKPKADSNKSSSGSNRKPPNLSGKQQKKTD